MPWLLSAVLLALPGCQSGSAAGNGDESTPLLVELAQNLAGPSPSRVARDVFDREDPDKRRRAIAQLSSADWGGEPAYLAVYRLILSDPDPTVRAACVAALGRNGQADDALQVAPQLEAEEAYLRWETAKALRQLRHEAVVPALVTVLQSDEDPDTRMAAAEALGQYRRRDVFDALVSVLTDREYGVAHAARRSLVLLTGLDLGTEPGEWQLFATTAGSGAMFANAQPYTYRGYVKPAGLLDKARFWRGAEVDARKRSAGVAEESAI